jgi:hypothetical protein
MHYKALVDKDGNLLIPGAHLPAGVDLDISADAEALITAAKTGSELRIEVLREIEPQEDGIWLKLAESSMDFWDNPVDDAVWNNA